VPTFLRQWHERNGGGGDVRVLEVTMRDADGADANAVYFPMG
jgi:ribosomal protein L17